MPKEIEENQNEIEFKQDLIFGNSTLKRTLYEYKVTKKQYEEIINLMGNYGDKIAKGITVTNGKFEDLVYNLIPQQDGNYYFLIKRREHTA